MKRAWISRLGDINKELLLILSIIAAAGVVNFFIAGQRLVLTFYNLPTLLAAWSPDLLFALAGAYLLLRTPT